MKTDAVIPLPTVINWRFSLHIEKFNLLSNPWLLNPVYHAGWIWLLCQLATEPIKPSDFCCDVVTFIFVATVWWISYMRSCLVNVKVRKINGLQYIWSRAMGLKTVMQVIYLLVFTSPFQVEQRQGSFLWDHAGEHAHFIHASDLNYSYSTILNCFQTEL